MKLTRYSLIIVLLVLFSCTNDDDSTTAETTEYEPGIVLTLDDDYVDDWTNAHEILREYDWRATFFVTKFAELNTLEIEQLHALKDYGHEIAGHGLNHIDARNYVAQHGADAYLEAEIYPMVSLMDNNGLHAGSFAYPFGARNTATDDILFDEFTMLRGTTYGQLPPASHNCYYTGNRLVYGLGLDNSYAHFDLSYFLSLLDYAKSHNKIVIFYAHKPVATVTGEYQTELQTLITICNYVKANNMKFYKISELDSL